MLINFGEKASNPDNLIVDYKEGFPMGFARALGFTRANIPDLFDNDNFIVGKGYMNGRWPIHGAMISEYNNICNNLMRLAEEVDIEYSDGMKLFEYNPIILARRALMDIISEYVFIDGYSWEDCVDGQSLEQIIMDTLGKYEIFYQEGLSRPEFGQLELERYISSMPEIMGNYCIPRLKNKNIYTCFADLVGLHKYHFEDIGKSPQLGKSLINGKSNWNYQDIMLLARVGSQSVQSLSELSKNYVKTSDEEIRAIMELTPYLTAIAWQIFPNKRNIIEYYSIYMSTCREI